MIFSVIILLLVGVIGYFYYVQGLFTGMLSAIAGAIAAVLAISYHEKLVELMFRSRMTDNGSAISLVLIFALTFAVLRIAFDMTIPGNIRLPALLDKIGGAAMGLILGIFATGVFAIAAQTMPFGPAIMGQSRFKTQASRDVRVPTERQALDETVSDELTSEKFDDNDRQGLLLPVDEWVLGFVSRLSDGGSLAGDRTLVSVHPNYLDELFGQRIGIQPGVSHVAVNAPGHESVSVPLAFLPPALAEADSEITAIRGSALRSLKPALTADAANAIVVIRVMFTHAAADEDGNVRFTTGGVRLVANGNNFYPLGTLDGTGALLLNKPDDPLFVGVTDADHGADMVFFVPRDPNTGGVLQAGSAAPVVSRNVKPVPVAAGEFRPGVFIEVKRLGRVDLTSVKIVPPQAPDKTVNVLRKKGLVPPTAPLAIGRLATASAEGGDSSPFVFDRVDVSPDLFHSVAVGSFDGDPGQATFPSGTAEIRGKKIAKLMVNPVIPLNTLGDGDNALSELFVPPGMKAVQLVGTLPPKAADPWSWAEHLGEFAIVAADDQIFKPSGAVAKVIKAQQPMVVAAYNADAAVASIPNAQDARPTDVTLLFLVPDSTVMKELDFQGKRLVPLNKSVSE